MLFSVSLVSESLSRTLLGRLASPRSSRIHPYGLLVCYRLRPEAQLCQHA